MASSIRWGLLSTARINRALIPPIKSLPRHSLRAVASRDAARAKAYAAEWDIPVAYGSYDALLADPEIDAIYNPLPNGLHAEWTIRAAQAGKHVLCEKPLALSVAEVDRIADAAAAHDVVVTEAFMYRHHPQTMQLKELLESGTIGDVLVIRGAFTFTLTRPGDVRFDAGMGGGSLWDVGCYPVSMARYLTGREPSRVVGWQRAGAVGHRRRVRRHAGFRRYARAVRLRLRGTLQDRRGDCRNDWRDLGAGALQAWRERAAHHLAWRRARGGAG